MINKIYKNFLSVILVLTIIILFWYFIVNFFEVRSFLFPSPEKVFIALYENFSYILDDAKITSFEILAGFLLGSLLGIINSLLLERFKFLRKFLLPTLVVSQSIPLYAIAPLLVLWFGYDLAPKIVMTVIVVFFPVTMSFYDGLRSTFRGYIDLAKSLGFSKLQILFRVKFIAALPELGSGLRVAATYAPIGAIVGEWIGASSGLGYRIIYFSARMQTAEMFASLLVLLFIALVLYFAVDFIIKKVIFWRY